MRDEKDHYKTLQVDPGADPEVITAAFRTLTRKLHPDLDFTGIEEYHLAELTRAYEILHDPAERKAYDLRRAFKLTPVGPGQDHPVDETELPSHFAERVHAHMDGPDTDGERRLDFGRYSGQSLREIGHTDPDYLRWLSRHSSGIRFRGAINRLLSEKVADPYSGRPSR